MRKINRWKQGNTPLLDYSSYFERKVILQSRKAIFVFCATRVTSGRLKGLREDWLRDVTDDDLCTAFLTEKTMPVTYFPFVLVVSLLPLVVYGFYTIQPEPELFGYFRSEEVEGVRPWRCRGIRFGGSGCNHRKGVRVLQSREWKPIRMGIGPNHTDDGKCRRTKTITCLDSEPAQYVNLGSG